MSTTVRVNGTAQFTFFWSWGWTLPVTSCISLTVILVTYFSSLKYENRLNKHVQNGARKNMDLSIMNNEIMNKLLLWNNYYE